MHKKLMRLFALMLLPVLLMACNEHATESKVDKDTLSKTLQKAMDTAKELDNITTKAYGMARVGEGMASIDPVKAGQTLNQAMVLANQARSAQYRSTLAELQSTTTDWPSAEKEQVADAIDRIQNDTTRVWLIRAIAEGIMINDPSTAKGILTAAADQAVTIPNARYRDLDLRSIASLMARMDTDAAKVVASRIGDREIKCCALIDIGKAVAGTNRDGAELVLKAAAEAAESVARMEPKSDLLVPDASQATKDAVLGADKAKLVAMSARSLANVAVAMNAVNPSTAKMIADQAAETATAIDAKAYPYTRAYAMSDVAIAIAGFDMSKSTSIIDEMDVAHPDARVAAMLAVIKARAGSENQTNMLSAIEDTVKVAESIPDAYDKAKSLAALGEEAIPYNKDKAVEIAGMIEEPLGNDTYGYSLLKDQVLADVAVAWTGEDDDIARKILDPKPEELLKDHKKGIEEPRFAKNTVLYCKAVAYLAMADKKLASDEKAAVKLYNKAAGTAADAKSTRIQWEVAKRLCKLQDDKLFDFAATIPPGDYANQAKALSDIAADWSAKGKPTADMVWDMAAKAANTLGDDMESSEALNEVASMCAKYDKGKATDIYAMSMKRIEKIGKEEG
jgi:hypothetical protein